MSQSSNTGNPMKSINCVISEPYYLLHFLSLFSYIPIRCSASALLISFAEKFKRFLHFVFYQLLNIPCCFWFGDGLSRGSVVCISIFWYGKPTNTAPVGNFAN
ncbi:uncharacterized protein LOC111383226 [Olea europaea var. sylvestris]|uniref:uncharacterized protein LOC111383226 n=1 Tax=Olea europaea var. sylvestris TaxID=158386 RepID=UPI000C1D3C96|nr:uncharacterized protein LOC111383226 [Olea europaea var. sylvestris]